MIIFMLCLNLLIHSNYGHSSNHGKHSPSEKSAEEDLVDFYGKSDEYSNESVKGLQTKNGYRQLGAIGNSISSNSYRKCRDLLKGNGFVLWSCMMTNDESNQQNIIQLKAEVDSNQQNIIQLKAEVLQLKKRLSLLSRPPIRYPGYDKFEYDDYY